MPNTSEPPPANTILGLLPRAEAVMRAENKSARTIAIYTQYMQAFAEFLDEIGLEHLDEITSTLILEFLTRQNLTPSERYIARNAISWLLRFLEEEEIILDADRICRRLRKVRLPKPAPQVILPVRVIRHAIELARAERTHAGKRDYLMLLILAETWIRIGELAAITTDRIVPNARIEIAEKGRGLHNGQRATAAVELSREAWRALADYLDRWRRPTPGEDPLPRFASLPTRQPWPLFTTKRRTRADAQVLRIAVIKRLREAADDLGVAIPARGIGPHTIRRSMASHALHTGEMSLIEVQKKLRHANIATTSRYLGLA